MTNHFKSVEERSLLLALLLSASMAAQAETLDAPGVLHGYTIGRRGLGAGEGNCDREYAKENTSDTKHL